MSKIFIDRPIFAWVIAIIIMLMGIGAIVALPVAQYPDVAPPQINIRATYPGASAQTLESSVTQVLEQQLTGIDGMLYFQSSSSRARQVDDQRRSSTRASIPTSPRCRSRTRSRPRSRACRSRSSSRASASARDRPTCC